MIPPQHDYKSNVLDAIQDFLCKLGMKPKQDFFPKSCHRQTYQKDLIKTVDELALQRSLIILIGLKMT